MQTHEAKLMYDPALYIKANLATNIFDEPTTEAPALLEAWKKANDYPDPCLSRVYGSMFLFQAGTMYGIRKERARRKRAGMEAKP